MKRICVGTKHKFKSCMQVDEFELHNVLCGMVDRMWGENPGDEVTQKEGPVGTIKIVPDPLEKGTFTPELVLKWEKMINDLITHMGTIDAQFHDDAEQTCM